MDAQAARKDLKPFSARSTTQFPDVAEIASKEVIVEDLYEDDELHRLSIDEKPASDSRMPGALEEAMALEYQRGRVAPSRASVVPTEAEAPHPQRGDPALRRNHNAFTFSCSSTLCEIFRRRSAFVKSVIEG